MSYYSSLTFKERQKRFKENLEEKRKKLIEQKNTNIDIKTGKKLFNPTINKNKKLDEERKENLFLANYIQIQKNIKLKKKN